MQPALHQNAGAAQVDGLLNLVEDHFLRMDVAFGMPHGPVERTETAILGAEIGVVDVAIDDIADDTVRMQLLPHRIGRHSDSNQIIAAIKIDRFLARHHAVTLSEAYVRNFVNPGFTRSPSSKTIFRVRYSRAKASEIPSFECSWRAISSI